MRIAVAGAGIAGLATAIALARQGFAVDLYERSAVPEEVGAGIQLSPNAMAVLERLGLAGDLAACTSEPRGIAIRDALSGAQLAEIPLGETARRRYGAPYRLVHRADLQAALLTAIGREPSIALRRGEEVDGVAETDRKVRFRAGGRQSQADLLIAADGIHSHTRTRYFGYRGPAPLGRTAWRAMLPSVDVPETVSLDETGLWLGPGAHLVHYPVRRGAALNLVVIGEGPARTRPPRGPFGRKAQQLLDAVPAWTPWPLSAVDTSRPWARGRVLLVGDAAHAMAPSAAQGGAQAIEDAWFLAQALAHDPAAPVDALARYERARRPRVERIVTEAARNLAIYNLRGLPAFARNLALRTSPALLLLMRLDWLFTPDPSVKNS